jgi:hypothetical protein
VFCFAPKAETRLSAFGAHSAQNACFNSASDFPFLNSISEKNFHNQQEILKLNAPDFNK